MSDWEVIRNPAWDGMTPQGLAESDCHDRSHFIQLRCRCGADMHIHETAVKRVPRTDGTASVCTGCGELLVFGPGELPALFARLRKEGWIK